MFRFRPLLVVPLIYIALSAASSSAWGWAHQGHILITRLAALRIIEDPAAPRALRDFLKSNMQWTLDDCRKLATEQTVGSDPADHPAQFNTGLDKWSTMPDQIKSTAEGRKVIFPYGVPETRLHFMDMEVFGKRPVYVDDLSNKPDVDAIPHDVHEPRWKRSGFVPLRVEECYHRLIDAFGHNAAVADPEDAVHWAGYLAHYLEDSFQPQHATSDPKSFTYLAGRLKEIPAAATRPGAAAIALVRVDKSIDPHGDLEFELFENADAPRAAFRREYWEALMTDIAQAAQSPAPSVPPIDTSIFRLDLGYLSDSYDYLPFVGHAAQAGYASGKFDVHAFFAFEGESRGRYMTTVQLIALQNAKAVIALEALYRRAWAEAHTPIRDTP